MGPFTREDMSQVQGMSSDSLVCQEGAHGAKDADWRSAVEVPELSPLFSPGAAMAAAPAREMEAGPPDSFERFREQSHLAVDGFGFSGEWTSGVFEDPALFFPLGSIGGLRRGAGRGAGG